MGSFRVGRHTFEDHEPYGRLTVAEVLKHSSNIGAMKLGLALGREALYEALRAFRFGERLTGFPQEAPGRVPSPKSWSATSIPAIAMGYEVMVTPLQLACAYAAIANDGLMVRPRFVLRPEELQPPEALGRAVSVPTARRLRAMLQGVVEEGTGKPGRPHELSAAGKTGTAKKLDPRSKRYSPTAVRATFAGMVPAEEPRLVILVSLDEPKVNPWGGLAAAPVFKSIAEQAMAYLRMPRPPIATRGRGGAQGPASEDAAAQRRLDPATRTAQEPAERRGASAPRRLDKSLADPRQLLGLGLREVLREARRTGWTVRVEGSGYATRVTESSPPAPDQDRSRVLVVQFEAVAPAPGPPAPADPAPQPSPAQGRER
jgi:cell division protein FtsI (penicillin-binding protein 3)